MSVCPRILSVVTMIGLFYSGFKFLLLLNNMEYCFTCYLTESAIKKGWMCNLWLCWLSAMMVDKADKQF
jgi:hypothetical protein